MPAPGSLAETVTAPPSSGAPILTGTAFIVLATERGPSVPTLVRSADAATIYGDDVEWSHAGRILEGLFRCGAKRAWVQRLFGPTPVKASKVLNGSGATASVKFEAVDAGAYANDYQLAVIAGTGSNIKLQLSSTSGAFPTLTSADLATKADVLAYTGFANYGTLTSAGAGTLPVVVAASSLTGGDDDHANITDMQRTTALAALDAAKGPGQVMLPGDTRPEAAALLGAHAAATNRVAFVDWPDTTAAGTILAALAVLRTDPNADRIAAFGPWPQARSVVNGGDPRDIPPSVVQAGITARQDAVTRNPNEPVAGDNGTHPRWVIGVKAQFTDSERDLLNAAGGNVMLDLYGNGVIRTYGNRTVVDPITDRLYLQLSNVRLDMAIMARGKVIADRYVLRQVDGKGKIAGQYAGELTAMLQAYRNDEALFPDVDPDTQQEIDPGYLVDAGPLVNTPEVLEAMQLIAIVRVRRSPGSELVVLRVVNYLPTESF